MKNKIRIPLLVDTSANPSALNQYDTVAEALQAARQRQYTVPFSFRNGMLVSESSGQFYDATQVCVDAFHRCEGYTDPSDSAIIYFLNTTTGERGWLVDAYGPQGNAELAAFMAAAMAQQSRSIKS